MKHIKLSICIGVYNQIGLLRENVVNILSCDSDEIEVVISDNNSEEDIAGFVNSINDRRVKYNRLSANVGQDLNLINGMRYCSGDYVLILRTKDTIYPMQIKRTLDYLTSHSNVGYFLFSANDELEIKRMYLEEKEYEKGNDAFMAIMHLLSHPSGQVFKRSAMDLDLYEKTIQAGGFMDYKSFILHELIRLHIAASYPIRTSSIVFWKYALTERSTVVSQLSKGVKTDLHIPDMEYPRFRCIFTFASSCSDGLTRTKLLTALAVKWFNKITYGFYLRNKNIEMLNHYNCVPIKFDIHHERIRFMDYFDGLLDQMEEVEKSARSSMRRRLKKECFLECTFRPVRRVLSKIKRVLIGH